jgi:hypothetical protein
MTAMARPAFQKYEICLWPECTYHLLTRSSRFMPTWRWLGGENGLLRDRGYLVVSRQSR